MRSSGRWPKVAAEASEKLSREILATAQEAGAGVASFKRMSGTIQVKKANSAQWFPATSDMELGHNDLVKTDGQSRSEIVYGNGTKLVVEPNSLIQIIRPDSSRDSITEIEIGGGQIFTGKVRGLNRVSTPDGTAVEVAQNSDTMVVTDREKGTEVYQGAGEASVSKGDEQVRLEGNEAVKVGDEGIGSVEKLPERPQTPDNLLLFEYDEGESSKATLRWEPAPEAAGYLLEVSRDELLSGSGVSRIELAETSFLVEGYPDGDYYWRVTTVGSSGAQSLPSPVQTFRIGPRGTTTDEPKRVAIPQMRIVSVYTFGTSVILKGVTDVNNSVVVDGEQVEVKADGSFQAVTTLRDVGENEVVVIARNAVGGTRRTRILVVAEIF